MALDVGELVANLRVNTRSATTDLAKGETALKAQATKAGTSVGQSAGSAVGKSLGTALKAGLAIGAGFIAFKGVSQFVSSAIDQAKELNESVARSKAVFGTSQSAVEKWAATTDTSLGLSKQAALEFAAQIGDVYEKLGFAAGASADLSEKTANLAVQIGAFKKVDPTDVLNAMSAAFRGQTRGLAALVPGITTATIQTEALSETGKTNAKTLTAQEKATATLTLVQKNSGAAQKFYAETTGESAHQQQVLNAQLDNMKASLGQAAIPLLTDMVKILNSSVIPAVETAGADLKELAHDINSLPTPVKAAGASLLALVLLGPEIRELADSVGNNLSSALETARIQALYMKDDFNQAGGGIKGLTASIGKGAGEGLRGAASGLLGIVGGPWGLAFIGASAAVGVLISKHEQGKAVVDSFTKAVEADSGALGANTRAAVVNALSKTDAFKQANLLGISLQDLTDDLLGVAPAASRVNAAIADNQTGFHEAQGRSDQFAKAANGLASTLGNTGNQLNQGVTAAKNYASAMGPAGDATDGAATAQDGLTTSTDGTTTATKKATKAVETWIETLDKADGKAIDLKTANIDFKQSLADADAALKKNGKTLDTNTQKGRDNASALLAVATSAQARVDAEKAAGESDKQVKTHLDNERDALYKVARQFGLSKTAAKNYVNQVLGIPKKAATKVSTPGLDAAMNLIQTYTGKVEHLQNLGGVNTTFRLSEHDSENKPKKAMGGEIGGSGGPTQDNQLILASPGEYVVNAMAYKRNKTLVRAINEGAKGFKNGGLIGRYATGGEVDITGADIGTIFGNAGASHSTKSDVTAASHSRTLAVNRLKDAEHALHVERNKAHPDNAKIHADERRIAADREAVNTATKKLNKTQASYNAGKRTEIQKVNSAAHSDVKTVGTFIKNLQTLENRGFGALAQVFYAEYANGDEAGAESAAAGAVKETNKQLTGLTNDLTTSASQAQQLSNFGTTGSFTPPPASAPGFTVSSGGAGLSGSQFGSLINVETVELLSGSPADIANTLAFKLNASG